MGTKEQLGTAGGRRGGGGEENGSKATGNSEGNERKRRKGGKTGWAIFGTKSVGLFDDFHEKNFFSDFPVEVQKSDIFDVKYGYLDMDILDIGYGYMNILDFWIWIHGRARGRQAGGENERSRHGGMS